MNNYKQLVIWLGTIVGKENIEEFENYFEKDAMIFYYLFTEVFLLADNRAKNMFLTTFDGEHWFPIPYDMDTAIGRVTAC